MIPKEKLENGKERLITWTRGIWDIWKIYFTKFSQYYYKIAHDETILGIFYEKLPYPINSIMNQKYIAWLDKIDVIDTVDIRISYLRK